VGADPPLVVDIDGTLTDRELVVHAGALTTLREWGGPVVVATGKALPYATALCQFAGVDRTVVAENGGLAFVGETDDLLVAGDPAAAEAARDAYVAAGHGLGWGEHDLPNRWRETELIVSRDAPLAPLEDVAAEHGLEVVDTGFAYHVKSPEVSKGAALASVAACIDRDPGEFVAVGDSENDVSVFETVGESYAVANADPEATAAADVVTDAGYGEGFLEAVERIREG
jgi:phosphoglycolate phosphatase (TIGR01487 family)